jgi:hypothetical protein
MTLILNEYIMQITIYSTCQGDGLVHYLKLVVPSNYNFTVIRNYQLILNNDCIPINILNNTDVFIYQEMGSKWGIYSTCDSVDNNILSHLPNKCKKIIIPYVYASWQWAIIDGLERDQTMHFNQINKTFDTRYNYLNKEIIQNLKKEYNLEQIFHLYDEGKIDFKYKERFENELSILRQKENNSHIKVCDFIIENYKKQQLFTTQNHPTNPVFKHMVYQILELINFIPPYNKMSDDSFSLPGNISFSSYDIKYHAFEFPCNIDDNLIINYITNIYNNNIL